ncbi:MAG TPA: hypothetical protein VFT59_04345 [Candidatus Saccharimonadales bacterium]|nr:hypothetical protein [Candidatus Saccharimonadales bacterium]
MTHSTDQPSDDARWWLSFERPQYPQPTISSSDIQQGLQFRRYHSRWSRHHTGMRLFDSSVMTVLSDIFSDNTTPTPQYIHAPRSVIECYDHDYRSKTTCALSDLGLEPHRTDWGLMWSLSAFCTAIDAPRMRWDEPRPNHEGMLDITGLQAAQWIFFHHGGRRRLMEVKSDVRRYEPHSAYGGLAITLYERELQNTSEWTLEDLGILPYVNPNGERWGDTYCTLAYGS